MRLTCTQCGDIREIATKPKAGKGLICRACSTVNKMTRTLKPPFYTTCIDCGVVRELKKRNTASKRCRSCATRLLMSTRSGWTKDKIVYTYFCPTCPTVNVLKAKRQTSYCGVCSRKYTKRKSRPDYIYFDMENMMYTQPIRMFRVCKWCNDKKPVTAKSKAGIGSCIKCKHLDKDQGEIQKKRNATRAKRGTKSSKTKTTRSAPQYSKAAIEKVRAVNKAHHAAVQSKEAPMKSRFTDKEMIDRYLETNEVLMIANGQLEDIHMGCVMPKGYTSHY